jgi:hypothetical protein
VELELSAVKRYPIELEEAIENAQKTRDRIAAEMERTRLEREEILKAIAEMEAEEDKAKHRK